MRVLVTGGAGYIGSHTCVQLLEQGHEVMVLDNFSNSSPESLRRVQQLAGRSLEHENVDITDEAALDAVFGRWKPEAVIHFAGYKAVGESVSQPLAYYRNNVYGALALCDAMVKHGCFRLVFSSSATVYGDPATVPIREDFPLSTTNPYGASKLMIEEILSDMAAADERWSIAILRYFNPVGAHASGEIGEDPKDTPNNLMPYVTQVAVGRLKELSIFGDDYDTPDGTGVRDYIHVVDLAAGHLAAIDFLQQSTGAHAINLGTGQGYSVLEMVKAFETVTGQSVPYRIVDRRPGDIANCYADPSMARGLLGWQAIRGLEDMVRDAWLWQSKNPQGFDV